MTEILLNAILNLFSIQATLASEERRVHVRGVIHSYLTKYLRISQPDIYLELYDLALDLHEYSEVSVRLEQAAQIARALKPQLPRLEQYVFLLRYLELEAKAGLEPAINADFPNNDHARSLADVVATELAITREETAAIRAFCREDYAAPGLCDYADFLLFQSGSGSLGARQPAQPTFFRPDFHSDFAALFLRDVGAYFISPLVNGQLSLDSIPMTPGSPAQLPDGSILRDTHGARMYFNEISTAFCQDTKQASSLVFRGEDLDFRYPGSDNGLHDFSFCLKGGGLVGVMGVSGAGKSTLLSILNGQMRPDSGHVRINGVDLHADERAVEGVIGYVPQDDLLFEDLTVFDNLYYSASLCMDHLSKAQRRERVDALLHELQQPGIRDLKVGSPLDKTISGGQRKRLNIALELIREPSILFVDEPTSGLSSSDSENVMSLLKAQAAQGRLIIVVIHQPSSQIFKMFNRLWVLDQGGRPIYDGNPMDAIVHFRKAIHQAGMDEYACPQCGSVNPEQLFEIIESRNVDDAGRYIPERRVTPQEWHELYLEAREKNPIPLPDDDESANAPEKRLWRPGLLGQLSLFFSRQVKSRMANKQYLCINLLEPPLLAFLAALISHGAWGREYIFMDNSNIGTYLFISVIVALFMGMSVSAEEINRDRKILRREQFLHLSRPCYLASKTLYLALVASVQMALFTLVGTPILELPNMVLPLWTTLFSCAMVSSVLALNISDSFRSAVTIYILIPLLLVPQMMLGGAVIPLDELTYANAGHRNTPLVANIMPSRWGYEALVVEQYTKNSYTRHLLEYDRERTQAAYMVDYHIPEIRSLADYPLLPAQQDISAAEHARRSATRLAALRNEIRKLEAQTSLASNISDKMLDATSYDASSKKRVKSYLRQAATFFKKQRTTSNKAYLAAEKELRHKVGRNGLERLKQNNYNEDIGHLVMNRKTFESVRLSGEHLVQVAAPVCMVPPPAEAGFFTGAPLFVAEKRLGPWLLNTFAYNLIVLWGMVGILYCTLHMRVLPRLLSLGRKPS